MLLFQLFMIEPIRAGLLSIEGAAEDVEEEFAVEKGEGEVTRKSCYVRLIMTWVL